MASPRRAPPRAPGREREAADEQWLRRWRRTPAHARAPARGGQGRAAAPAVDLRGGKRGRGFRSEESGDEWRARVFDGD